MEKKKNTLKKYISWIALALVVVLLATMPMLARGSRGDDGNKPSILSVTAQRRQVDTLLLGGGALVSQDPVAVTVPENVKLTGYCVGNGDTVKKGDVVATVDRVTVMQAITQTHQAMEELQEQLQQVSDQEAPDKVKAQADGRVKAVYAREGDDAREVMLQHGALAVLSLDGCMAAQLACDTSLQTGEDIPVTLDTGEVVTGQVKTNRDGILTVTVEDRDYPIGAQVQLGELGTARLYVHAPWNAIAYSGTVSDVAIEEADKVSQGKTLFRLEDTGHTAEFYRLAALHREYEQQLLELFVMYQDQILTAPADGVITGVDADAYLLAARGGYSLSLLANAPNGDDSVSYINYVGVITAVGIDGLGVRINPAALEIPDYKDLSGVPLDRALMTESVVYSDTAPVYQLEQGSWVQVDSATLTAGDILLFAGDSQGDLLWLVRISAPAEPETPTDPTEPTDPTDPTIPTDPSVPGYPGYPDISFPDIYYPSIDMESLYGDLYPTLPQEEQLYSLDTVTVASVTSQEELMLQITVDEMDIGHICPGQRAEVTVEALPGERFTALVTQVASAGENSGGNSKFTVELSLEKSGDMLPGMKASAYFTLDSAEDVLCLPVEALAEEGGKCLVYTGYDQENETLLQPVAVTTGVSDGMYVQILSGLEEGDVVYYAYYDTLVISNIPDLNDYDFF